MKKELSNNYFKKLLNEGIGDEAKGAHKIIPIIKQAIAKEKAVTLEKDNFTYKVGVLEKGKPEEGIGVAKWNTKTGHYGNAEFKWFSTVDQLIDFMDLHGMKLIYKEQKLDNHNQMRGTSSWPDRDMSRVEPGAPIAEEKKNESKKLLWEDLLAKADKILNEEGEEDSASADDASEGDEGSDAGGFDFGDSGDSGDSADTGDDAGGEGDSGETGDAGGSDDSADDSGKESKDDKEDKGSEEIETIKSYEEALKEIEDKIKDPSDPDSAPMPSMLKPEDRLNYSALKIKSLLDKFSSGETEINQDDLEALEESLQLLGNSKSLTPEVQKNLEILNSIDWKGLNIQF